MERERERESKEKDWTGSRRSPFANLGASNHSQGVWEKGFKGDPVIRWIN